MTLNITKTIPYGGDFDELSEILEARGLNTEEIEASEHLAKNGNINLSTIIKADSKATVKKPYVLAFTHNLKVLARLKITNSELLVLAYILEAMEYGNLISLNQNQMKEDTGLSQPSISRSLNGLRKKDIIVAHNGHTYINANLFAKGLPHRMKKEKVEAFRKVQSENNGNYEKSF